jgi:hypothetical protein
VDADLLLRATSENVTFDHIEVTDDDLNDPELLV